MKNLLLYSFFTLVSGKSDGQTQFGIYTEVRHNVFYYFHGGNGMYSESDLHLGGWVYGKEIFRYMPLVGLEGIFIHFQTTLLMF